MSKIPIPQLKVIPGLSAQGESAPILVNVTRRVYAPSDHGPVEVGQLRYSVDTSSGIRTPET